MSGEEPGVVGSWCLEVIADWSVGRECRQERAGTSPAVNYSLESCRERVGRGKGHSGKGLHGGYSLCHEGWNGREGGRGPGSPKAPGRA